MDKFLGLDLGIKSLGIAKSNSLGNVFGVENYNFPVYYYKKAREHLIEIIKETEINNIVIGLPLQVDRQEGERCASVRRFIDDLIKECDLELKIYFHDESYSTFEARERLQNLGLNENKIKEIIDMESAVVILEDFLNNVEVK